MKDEIIVKTENFTENDLRDISKQPEINKEALRIIEMYNQANYFTIKKLYINKVLKGFATVFLGYDGLLSTSAKLDCLCYYNISLEALNELINEVINYDDYPITIDKIYYDTEAFDTNLNVLLFSKNIEPIGIAR